MWKWFKANWKTNLTATIAVLYSAQQFTADVIAWSNHQPANWRVGLLSLFVAAGLYASRDASNVPTQAEVTQATKAASK